MFITIKINNNTEMTVNTNHIVMIRPAQEEDMEKGINSYITIANNCWRTHYDPHDNRVYSTLEYPLDDCYQELSGKLQVITSGLVGIL